MRFINPNFHVILIHYPLGVFVLGVFLELFGLLWRRSSIRTAARWMIVLGALLTIPATTSGMFAYAQLYQYAKVNDVNYPMLRMHVIYMGIASILATFCAVVGLGASDRWRKYLYLPLLLGVLGAWGLMVIGAWNAGETIFTQGTGVTISESKTLAAVIKPMDKPEPSSAVSISDSKTTGSVVSFQKQIRPIIAAACYDCHSSMKAEKGGLRLDTAARFREGGKKEGDKILVKGNPQASEMYRRITLPQDDDDVMPEDKPSAHPHLTTEQTDLVGAWIAQGADFGGWTADADPAAARAAARDAEAAEAKRKAGVKIVEVMSGHDKPSNSHPDFFDSVKNMVAVIQKTSDTMHRPGSKPEVQRPEPVVAQPDMMTVMKSSTPAEMMDHAGGAIQQHLVLAGFAFAAAFFALGLSIRRLHSPTLVKAALVVVVPPAPVAAGDAKRSAQDQNMTRVFNPRTAVAPATAVVHHIPSARFWLLTALIIVATASMGYWEAAGAANVLTPKGWTEFVHVMTPENPAVKLNRVGAHVVLGASFLALSLICAMLAAFAPKRPIMLGFFSLLLIAVIAAQVWMGVLLTFDKDAHDVSFFHRATAADFPSTPAPADVTQPTTAPSITPPATAPTTTIADTPDVTSTPHDVTIPLPTTRPATSPSITETTPRITIPSLTTTAPAVVIPSVTTTAPAVRIPSVTVTAPDVTTRPITVTPLAPTTLPVKLDHPARTPHPTTAPAVKKPAPTTRPARPATRPAESPATRPTPAQTAPAGDHSKKAPESD